MSKKHRRTDAPEPVTIDEALARAASALQASPQTLQFEFGPKGNSNRFFDEAVRLARGLGLLTMAVKGRPHEDVLDADGLTLEDGLRQAFLGWFRDAVSTYKFMDFLAREARPAALVIDLTDCGTVDRVSKIKQKIRNLNEDSVRLGLHLLLVLSSEVAAGEACASHLETGWMLVEG